MGCQDGSIVEVGGPRTLRLTHNAVDCLEKMRIALCHIPNFSRKQRRRKKIWLLYCCEEGLASQTKIFFCIWL